MIVFRSSFGAGMACVCVCVCPCSANTAATDWCAQWPTGIWTPDRNRSPVGTNHFTSSLNGLKQNSLWAFPNGASSNDVITMRGTKIWWYILVCFPNYMIYTNCKLFKIHIIRYCFGSSQSRTGYLFWVLIENPKNPNRPNNRNRNKHRYWNTFYEIVFYFFLILISLIFFSKLPIFVYCIRIM